MILNGKLYWAKVIGEPRPGYEPGELEWSFDLSLDEENKQKLLEAGVDKSKIKNKGDEKGDYIAFKRPSVKKDGSPAKPFAIVSNVKGSNGAWEEWDDRLLGNGTEANVMVAVNETTYKGKQWFKPSAIKIQIVDLVEYEGQEDFPEDGNDEWDDS